MTDDRGDERQGEAERAATSEAGLSPEPGLWLRAEKALGLLREPVVTTFRSHGAPGWLRVTGRVVEASGVEKAGEDADEGLLRNAWTAFRRLESDEIPGARVRGEYRGGRWETVSDDEGYFAFRLEPDEPLDPGWHRVPLTVEVPLTGDRLEAEAPVLVPSPAAAYGVISDLDDTVIRSHATDRWRQIRMLFGESARSRPPLPGVSELYRRLARGEEGGATNPFFYVSRSGWNLYDLFDEFMEVRGLPAGPFFMQDLSILEDDSAHIAHDAPKLERAAILLENYPDMDFILIGDSGQHDPENFRRVVDRHPGRILGVYIRDLDPGRDTERSETVRAIAREVRAKDVPMLLARDSLAMAEHARDALGILPDEGVEAVREDVERDEADGGR